MVGVNEGINGRIHLNRDRFFQISCYNLEEQKLCYIGAEAPKSREPLVVLKITTNDGKYIYKDKLENPHVEWAYSLIPHKCVL